MNRPLIIILPIIILIWSCKYSKQDIFISTVPGDSLQYVIASKGPGKKISDKASRSKLEYEYKGNSCQIRFLSDPALIVKQRGLLLFHATMPELEKDMLTKGYFGTFTSKQYVTYVLVSYEDFDRYFKKKKEGSR